jgi:hypothetical protein
LDAAKIPVNNARAQGAAGRPPSRDIKEAPPWILE